MKLKILKVELNKLVAAQVIEKRNYTEIIEGCLLYKMKEGIEPYMSYLETAPHNRGMDKKYDLVAGCLIAFACRLSFTLGKGD